MILGALCGPIFYAAEVYFAKRKWIADPVGLLPGHLVGGLFGVLTIAFFTQGAFAAASGAATLPNGILFGGGAAALQQLGIEAFGIAVVFATVFLLSFIVMKAASALFHGILVQETPR